jgi:hypothetical protein
VREGQPKRRGLVLDNFLAAVYEARRRFALPAQMFGLKEVLLYPGAEEALETLIREAVALHEFYVWPDALLDGLGEGIYGEEERTSAYHGSRVNASHVEAVLRRVFEVMLQVIVLVPPRDPRPFPPKKVKRLAAKLSGLVREVHAALRDDEVQGRIKHLGLKPEEEPKPWLLESEMRKAATVLDSGANLRRRNTKSPNPQVRHDVYLVRLVEFCTERPHYDSLQTLIAGAFHAAGKKPPKWVGRLAIEEKRDRELRKRRGLSSSS